MSKYDVSLDGDIISVINRIQMTNYSGYKITMIRLECLLHELKELKDLIQKAYIQHRGYTTVDIRLLKEIERNLWYITNRSLGLSGIFKDLGEEIENHDKIFGEFLKKMKNKK